MCSGPVVVSILEDETGNGDITLNGTDSDSVDAGDNIISESGIDFSNQDVTITDSSGASGTIIKSDIATATSSVETTATSVGEYSGIRSLMGEEGKVLRLIHECVQGLRYSWAGR